MLGDVADITGRLRAVLPNRWFSDVSPNLNALLGSLATPWSWLYARIQYTIQQSRLCTATTFWLDMIAYDFFGNRLLRQTGELDAAFRNRIQWALIQGAATRTAVAANVRRLTGFTPQIFEPSNCFDTGAYGRSGLGPSTLGSGMAYCTIGGWGSLNLPYQFFITVQRPVLQGVALLSGYGTPGGGYGCGSIAYVDLDLLIGNVSDSVIAANICNTIPVNATAWLRFI